MCSRNGGCGCAISSSAGTFRVSARSMIMVVQPFEHWQRFVAVVTEPRRILPARALAERRAALGRDPIWLPVDDADSTGVESQLRQVDHVAMLTVRRRGVSGNEGVGTQQIPHRIFVLERERIGRLD